MLPDVCAEQVVAGGTTENMALSDAAGIGLSAINEGAASRRQNIQRLPQLVR